MAETALDKFKYMMKGGAQADAKLGHGPFGENSDTYVDAKPYVQYFSNGIFEGYDGSVWKYFKFPIDVQTEWLINPEQALENQSFFIALMKEFGQMLDSQTEKVRNDVRRDFHIQITQTESTGIKPPASSSPAHADYLSRVSSQYVKPDWHGYLGVRLLPSDIFYEAHGFHAKVIKYWEAITNPTSIRWTELRKDIDDVEVMMIKHGFMPLDFIENKADLDQLTAWHGIGDEQHALVRQLQNVRMKEPIQGLSVITPKWGEVMFHALKPQDGVNLKDPLDETSRWAVPLYSPASNVVLVNIRGQVRAPMIADNLLDIKKVKRLDVKHPEEEFGSASVIDTIQYARIAVNDAKLPMLDNLEIVIGSIVPGINKTNPLINSIRQYGMELAPLIGRQHLGVLTSFPTYPRHVMRIPRGNAKRPELTNVMLPGILAMSGMFRSTKPCGPGGVLLGLSDAGDEFKEIYTETDAASKYNKVPGMLITGRPGAGKALPLDTPIMTPTGYVQNGDLKVGDTVFGSDGKPCTVTFVTEVMNDHELFKIVLSDGQEIIADADHQWVVSIPSDRHYYRGRDENHIAGLVAASEGVQATLQMTANEYESDHRSSAQELFAIANSVLPAGSTEWSTAPVMRSSLEFVDCPYEVINGRGQREYGTSEALSHLALRVAQRTPKQIAEGEIPTRRMTTKEMVLEGANRDSSRYSIPLAAPIQYPKRDLLVDPYIVGLWLGDGETGTGRIASGNVGLSTDENGIGDMEYTLPHLAKYSPRPKGGMEDYVISCTGLAPELREIGILNNKHIPEAYMLSSFDQRVALLQGLCDSDGGVQRESGTPYFSNTSPRLIDQVTQLVRSLGVKVHDSFADCGCRDDDHCTHSYPAPERLNRPVANGRTIVSNKLTMGVGFTTSIPVFRLPRKLALQNRNPGMRTGTLMIRSITPVETQPVRCISVDSPDHTYLVQGAIVTSNTQQLLQMTVQIANQGLPVAFFNPKKEGSLKPTFDYIGGITISMNRQYLEQNPGMLDPILFLTDRVEIASLLADSIFIANRMYEDSGSASSQRRTKIRTEIIERGKDERNRSSYDIIFGNGHPDPQHRTEPITDRDIVDFVSNKIQTAPFWTAFISKSAGSESLRNKIKQGRSFLIEWDRSMSLPDVGTEQKDYTDSQLDMVISVNVTFNYASAIISGTGGAIIVDESWVLKNSKEALTILERGGREWRQANIMLIMATQRIRDWMDSKSEKNGGSASQNMATFFDRYLIMAISENDTNELDMFFELTKQPRTKRIEHYITHAGTSSAGVKGNSIPRAFYMDKIYGWEGGIICGPWPERELNLGRTDKAGLAAKSANSAIDESSSVKGALAEVMADTQAQEFDLFEQESAKEAEGVH